ncbi:luciferase [Sinomonas cellulolyticus]|uniref:LLM class flavin-dependent oxidoreductase n=1 Tax=Sinomonas cellulolyticus TaxID=2801916 RepID=A0ABS1K784_9MICC|nr:MULTISPECIES: LLM class flavin-dependent oxidoreductase [Sinomonas]MBL0707365.1 LLM class flavin-dependent oxidoreductase [Sinomonas cellulolyticus]GHG50872.1 luciferase [Sinomonas sp. KCTC 49339]
MDFGIFTFGELTRDPSGTPRPAAQRIDETIRLAKLADEEGLDVIGLGEHHRHDFAFSAPEIVLAAIARETQRIRLTTAVTVLSTQDPARVFEQFATLDIVSGGRAEIIAGRGVFPESFPLFGYDPAEYDALFEDKLELLLQMREQANVTWPADGRRRGHHALHDAAIAPRPVQERLPIWRGVGGTPSSFVRAGQAGVPLFLALLSGHQHFLRLVELYRTAGAQAGHPASSLAVGTGSHFYVARTSQEARDTFYPHYAAYIEQNMPRPAGTFPREHFDAWAGPGGGLLVGSPAEVAERIIATHEALGTSRFMAQVGLGTLPFAETAESVELFAAEVVPMVKKALAAA